jgi:hypothetical protein
VLLSPRLLGELFLTELDEREETLEAWRQECNLLIRGFVDYLGNRFSAIEHRVDRLEQLVEERYGYQKDGICT